MTYHAPTDLNEALSLLAAGPLSLLAGGTDHFAARPPGKPTKAILDITRIGALRGIDLAEDTLRIGATTTWSDVARSDLPAWCDGLRQAAVQVGSLQIQNSGTIAGNICNASPAADGVPPLLTLDAEVELTSLTGIRHVPLSEFLTGVRRTVRRPDELVSALHIPVPPAHARGGFDKLGSRHYLVISIAMVAVLIGIGPDGRIDHARVAVGACSPVAQRLASLEAHLIGRAPSDLGITVEHLSCLSPIDDVRGSAGYRLEAVMAQIPRAIQMACGEGKRS